MRMRKLKHGDERRAACKDLMITSKADIDSLRENGKFPCFLEIGCGKGDFILESAKRSPDKTFIAMEKIGDVAVKAMEKVKASETPINNVKFIIGDAQNLTELFKKGDVAGIYLNFSDPWPKAKHAKRRLTYRKFLDIYKSILSDDGFIIFKTDNRGFFDFSVQEFAESGFELKSVVYDLHNSEFKDENILTEYERNFSAKGFKINQLIAYIK